MEPGVADDKHVNVWGGGNDISVDPASAGQPAAVEDRARDERPRVMYKAGDMPSESSFDSSLLPNVYSFINGRATKNMKSKRPPDIFPEVWNSWNAKQKEEARQDYLNDPTRNVEGAPASSAGQPAPALSSVMNETLFVGTSYAVNSKS